MALLLTAGVLPVLAHAELVSSDPADGAQLATPPTTITLTFSEGVVASRSSFDLLLSGQRVGTGKAAKDGDTTMSLGGLTLAPGEYTIQWTSVADDGDLLRGTVTFTVLAPTPAPSVAVASASPSAAPSPTRATPTAVAPTSQASADATPVASTGTDVLLPIVVGLVLIAGVGAFLFRRTRRA